jgi:outer membrane protein TolC
MAYLADSESQRSRAAAAQRFPDFTLGADYIVTEAARSDGVSDSGKDAVSVTVGAEVPLFWGVYGAERDEAQARQAMFEAREAAVRDAVAAELEQTLSELDESIRRAQLYGDTLVPQAEAVYGSVLGGYQAGTSTVSAMLDAQRELLELELGLYRTLAEHAEAWARLESVVGRPLRAVEVQ